MLRDLLSFLKALASNWIAIVTGTAVSLALLLWDVYADDEVLTLPRFVSLFLPITLFVAAFVAWRREHAERRGREKELLDIAARKPEGKLTIVVEDREVYCDVTNLGAQGWFQARLSAPGISSSELRDVPAVWLGNDRSPMRMITTGHTVRLHIGHFKSVKTFSTPRVADKELSHSWLVFYATPDSYEVRYTPERKANTFQEQEVVIRLICEPEMKQPLEINIKLGLNYVMNQEDKLITMAPRES